jgi:hypothetical protein
MVATTMMPAAIRILNVSGSMVPSGVKFYFVVGVSTG